MPSTYNVMIMGASYGSLLATKLLFAGHKVKLVCLPSEAELINQEGTRVRLPIKGKSERVEIDSRKLPGHLSADVPTAVNLEHQHGLGRHLNVLKAGAGQPAVEGIMASLLCRAQRANERIGGTTQVGA